MGPVAIVAVVDADRPPSPAQLGRFVRAVAAQTSDQWELHLGVVGTLPDALSATLVSELATGAAARLEVSSSPAGTPRALAARSALRASSSEAVVPLDVRDRLAPDALAVLATALSHDEADVAYADEDRVSSTGAFWGPLLKPDWSPELLSCWRYTGHPVMYRCNALQACGGIGTAAEGDWEHDLLLRLSEHTDRVAHVAEVLCHREDESFPLADAATASDGDAAPVSGALARRGELAEVDPGPIRGSWRIRRRPRDEPTVSVIIPFRDNPWFLRACVDSLVTTATGVRLDVILVDNGSSEPETAALLDRLEGRPRMTILRDPRPFNWAALNNAAAAHARGDVLLFLNDDVEARAPGWVAALSSHALRPHVGAAGARLLYPNGSVQHVGVALGVAGPAVHLLAGLPGDEPGYLGMAQLTRDVSAVTGACLATRGEVFERLGGFDEALGVECSDIDYCLKARASGLRIVCEANVDLVHHESPSRGTSYNSVEVLRFCDRWADVIDAGDPYLNRNLSRAGRAAALRGPHEGDPMHQWRIDRTLLRARTDPTLLHLLAAVPAVARARASRSA